MSIKNPFSPRRTFAKTESTMFTRSTTPNDIRLRLVKEAELKSHIAGERHAR